jgi:predicted O-methyltransferase YrrM
MNEEIHSILENSHIVCDILENFTNGETGNTDTIKLLCTLGENKDVFEFGTFQGRTTRQIALFAKSVTTFDLGLNTSGEGEYPDYEVGKYSKDMPNVTQLIGNSLTFDFSPYYGKFDLVYVDGGHSFECITADFAHATQLVRPGGIVIVDDTNVDYITTVVDTAIQSGQYSELDCFPTVGYQHRLLRKC